MGVLYTWESIGEGKSGNIKVVNFNCFVERERNSLDSLMKGIIRITRPFSLSFRNNRSPIQTRYPTSKFSIFQKKE